MLRSRVVAYDGGLTHFGRPHPQSDFVSCVHIGQKGRPCLHICCLARGVPVPRTLFFV